jgi:adenylylsulfate kinase
MQKGSTLSQLSTASALRCRKEALLDQHAKVIWMCGLSGAGKSTLAISLENELTALGYLCQVIDGDDVRSGLNIGLGYTQEDRRENLRRVAEVAKMAVNSGIITVVSFISPTHSIREMIRTIIGTPDYIEVFVNAPLEICEQRDTKGLYQQAREGKIRNFTGIDSPFEPPVQPDVVINTHLLTVDECGMKLLEYVLPLIEYNK